MFDFEGKQEAFIKVKNKNFHDVFEKQISLMKITTTPYEIEKQKVMDDYYNGSGEQDYSIGIMVLTQAQVQ